MEFTTDRWRELSLWADALGRKSTQWLEAHLAHSFQTVSPGRDAMEGYAGILASAAWGGGSMASYLLDQAVRHWMVSPGEFHFLDEPEVLRRRSFVRNSVLLLAASKLGRADVLSELASRRLLSYQHRSGGFFGMDPGQGQGLVESFTTAWGGRTALRLAWFEQARRAAQLLADMIFMQPDPEGRFYFYYDTLSSAVLTRWRGAAPQARYIDFQDTTGETHQLGAVMAFLAEMHMVEPAAGWDRPLLMSVGFVRRWLPALMRLPGAVMVAEGLALTAWALGKAGEEALQPLPATLDGISRAVAVSGASAPFDAGLGAEYDRAYSAIEASGWTAVSLAGLSQALGNLRP